MKRKMKEETAAAAAAKDQSMMDMDVSNGKAVEGTAAGDDVHMGDGNG